MLVDTLESIREEALNCSKCPELAAFRNKVAFSYGSGKNGLMIIGTAPSIYGGNITGMPMSEGKSKSGSLIFEILRENSIIASECYITNVLFCATPNNREPKPVEIKNCAEYTRREIRLIKPKLVILLGKVALHALLGRAYQQNEAYEIDGIKFVAVVHPSFVLRQNSDKATKLYKAQFSEAFESLYCEEFY